MKVRLFVRLKPSILDPQGRTLERSMAHLGIEASEVRVGKLIEFQLPSSGETARRQAHELAARLLANPIIEDYEFEFEDQA